MICRFCRNDVLGSGKSWGFHHNDPALFHASVTEGCVFCSKLAADLKDIDLWFPPKSVPTAIYRWTIRKQLRLRESQDAVIVTFRSVPEIESAGGGDKSVDLPDRIFHMLPQSDLDIPSIDQLEESTDSDRSWKQVAKWIDNCIKNHPKCVRRHRQDFMPTRLVDVGQERSKWPPNAVRLVKMDGHAVPVPYVTLSHCWGDEPFVELRDQNWASFLANGIPWHRISTNKNFVDAILVARRLGIRYIWIDSLCIIQKQPKREDFNREGRRMHQVYRNSYCNIAAAASKDRNGGLFSNREDQLDKLVATQYTPLSDSSIFGSGKWRVLSDDLWQEQLLSKTLYTRGWVFQERMLSPRLLHFSKSQIFWDCATLTACETLPSGLPLPLDRQAATDRHWRERLQDTTLHVQPLAGSANDSLEQFWKSCVSYFTGCNLREVSDKLDAIWGVAKLVRDALAEDYGAGLWDERLYEQLAWRVVDYETAERPDNAKALFPSWSWASVVGQVELADRIPVDSRFYYVTDHDDNPVKFRLRTSQYRRANDRSIRWDDETGGSSQRSSESSSMPSIQSTTASTSDSRRPSMITHGSGSSQTMSSSRNGGSADVPSELSVRSLAIKGHVVRRKLRKTDGQKNWCLTTESFDKDEAIIQAFPDSPVSAQESECDLVILSASRVVYGVAITDDDELEDGDLDVAQYSGTGLMLAALRPGRYVRTGSFAFQGLHKNAWNALTLGCCERESTLGSHRLEDGQCFWIDED